MKEVKKVTEVEAVVLKDFGSKKKGVKLMLHKNTAKELKKKGLVKYEDKEEKDSKDKK